MIQSYVTGEIRFTTATAVRTTAQNHICSRSPLSPPAPLCLLPFLLVLLQAWVLDSRGGNASEKENEKKTEGRTTIWILSPNLHPVKRASHTWAGWATINTVTIMPRTHPTLITLKLTAVKHTNPLSSTSALTHHVFPHPHPVAGDIGRDLDRESANANLTGKEDLVQKGINGTTTLCSSSSSLRSRPGRGITILGLSRPLRG